MNAKWPVHFIRKPSCCSEDLALGSKELDKIFVAVTHLNAYISKGFSTIAKHGDLHKIYMTRGGF